MWVCVECYQLKNQCPGPKGWQLVPKDPTEKMLLDGSLAWNNTPTGVSYAPWRNTWAAQLAVAPTPPALNEGWISVKDQLPELRHVDNQLVKFAGRCIPAMRTSDRVIVWLFDDQYMDQLVQIDGYAEPVWQTYGERVTYWRPKLAPPTSALVAGKKSQRNGQRKRRKEKDKCVKPIKLEPLTKRTMSG